RVDADAGEVGPGHSAPGHARLPIRRAEDVAPGGNAREKPEQVEEQADAECRPADRRNVLEERAGGVDDLAHAWTLDSGPWRVANTSTSASAISSTVSLRPGRRPAEAQPRRWPSASPPAWSPWRRAARPTRGATRAAS